MAYSQGDLMLMMQLLSSMDPWNPNYDILCDNIAQAIADLAAAGHATTGGGGGIKINLGGTTGPGGIPIVTTHVDPPPPTDPPPVVPPPEPEIIKYIRIRDPRQPMDPLQAKRLDDTRWKANSAGTNWYKNLWKSRPTINYLDPFYVKEREPGDAYTPYATYWGQQDGEYTLEYDYGIQSYYEDGTPSGSYSMGDAWLDVTGMDCSEAEIIRLSFNQFSSSTPLGTPPPFKGYTRESPTLGTPGQFLAGDRNYEGNYSSVGQVIGGIGPTPFNEAYCDANDPMLWHMDMRVRWFDDNYWLNQSGGQIGQIAYDGQTLKHNNQVGIIANNFGAQGTPLSDCFSLPVINSPFSYVDNEYVYLCVSDGAYTDGYNYQQDLIPARWIAFHMNDPMLWKTPVWPATTVLLLQMHAWPTPIILRRLELITHPMGY